MAQRIVDSAQRLMGKKPQNQADSRTIHVNDQQANSVFKFASNVVTTAKYNIITFLPKNLFEQFCRLANVYFLIISGFQQIDGVSPTGRWTTLGPLAFVLAVTALKEAYEDIKRHKQDNLVNNSPTEVLRDGQFVATRWKHVQTGDIVRVKNRQFIPADLLILASSEAQGMCYIETASLDGETNLKIRQALEETAHLDHQDALNAFKGTVNCELPNNRLYNFEGNLTFNSRVYPVGVKQILLRGAMLRNTKWVNGIAIFTGKDTKLVRNSRPTPLKRSNVERLTNMQIILIFAFEIVLCTISAIANSVWSTDHHDDWYLQFTRSGGEEGAWSWITFLILFNNLIPISLYVSMEAVKVVQALLIDSDVEMYYARNDTPASARTSNLNEELGQVEYIFSDKTGTLTQNLMQFRKCTIAGIVYGDIEGAATNPHEDEHVHCNDDRLVHNLTNGHSTAEVIREFLSLLAVCHTVIPDKQDDGSIVYQAASPDENALVSAAKFFGFEFHTRTPKTITVTVQGKDLKYEILNVLEFNSTRKRMSVICRTPEGKILLYTKGADTVIYERLSRDQPYSDITITHLQEFASEGLRTLCLAVAELDPVQYEEWNKIFYTASTTIINREEELDKAAELVEKNLFLLGATAIEDKLQDGVPETISILATAGIKIWVLTGDKQETAINIGFSCQLITEQMELMVINEDSQSAASAEVASRLSKLKKSDNIGELALIIDGHTLTFALEAPLKNQLLELAQMCKAVICCRVSPLQKALVVRLVRDNLKTITLAIGDGANDVSMIQAAHVGIGISGEEGLQAARASDYSIAQFRFLQRLLLIHGRNSYRRITKLILYCFYRNIALYITQFWFAIFNGWSGQTFYERFTLTAYNIVWTFFPVLMLGIFDKDVDDKFVFEHPQLYQTGVKKVYFNYKVFWGWVLNALWQSLVLYGFIALTFTHSNTFISGRAVDLFSMGTVSYTCVVITVNLKLALEIRYWTWANHFFLWGSIIAYAIWLVVYGVLFDNPTVDAGSDLYYVIFHLAQTPLFWFSIIIVPWICLFRDVTWKYVVRTSLPRAYHIIQEMEMLEMESKLRDVKHTKSVRPYTGFAFAQGEGEAEATSRLSARFAN